MDKLILPRMDVEKQKTVEKTRKDATEAAIAQVRAKIKEQLEAEQAAREAAEGEIIDSLLIHVYGLAYKMLCVLTHVIYTVVCTGSLLLSL